MTTAEEAAAAVEPAAADVEPKEKKKKKNMNPGLRQQGSRTYDSENGTSCHQCRQKTLEDKAACKRCSLFYCPRCLENRYGERVEEVNTYDFWCCPKCKGVCNCGPCRKKKGLPATGILKHTAQKSGYASVQELLKERPDSQHAATAIRLAKSSASQAKPGGKIPAGKLADAAHPAKKARKAAPVADLLVDDAQLGPRPAPLPPAAPLAVHREPTESEEAAAAAADFKSWSKKAPSNKRPCCPAWLTTAKLAGVTPLPGDVDSGALLSVLEFVSTFGQAALKLEPSSAACLHLPSLAAELVQPAIPRRDDQLCPVPEASPVAELHCKLLASVRNAWGLEGAVALSSWQELMREYLTESRLSPAVASAVRNAHGPPALAGESSAFGVEQRGDKKENNKMETSSGGGSSSSSDTEEGATAAGDKGNKGSNATGGESRKWSKSGGAASAAAAAVVPTAEYPAGGYWGLQPGVRVAMLEALMHDALDTQTFRATLGKAMDDAAEDEKARREKAAEVRKAAKAATAQQRDHEVALLMANSGSGKAADLEEQRKVLEEARAKAEAAVAEVSKLKLIPDFSKVVPAAVRATSLGQDRDGTTVFKLQAGAVLTGSSAGLVVCVGGKDEGASWQAYADPAAFAAALDPRGKKEGALRRAIATACGVDTKKRGAASGGDEGKKEEKKLGDKLESPPRSAKKQKTPTC